MFRSRHDDELVTLLFPDRSPAEVADAVTRLHGVGRVGPDEQGVTGLLTCARVVDPEVPASWVLLQVDREGYGLQLVAAALAAALGLAPEALRTPPDEEPAPADQRTVLVTPAADREYRPLGRKALGSSFEVREVGPWHLVTWQPAPGGEPPSYGDATGHLVGLLAANKRGSGIVITTERFHTAVYEVDRGRIAETEDGVGARHWPLYVWQPVFDPAVRDVAPAWNLVAGTLDAMLPQHADGAFRTWGDDPVRRRSAFRRESVDLPEVVAALGLPAETVAVLRDESTVPARRYDAVLVSEYVDDAPRFGRGSLSDRLSLVTSLVGVALLVTMLALGRDAVATPVWWFLVALGGMSVVDLVFRLGMALVRRRRTTLRAGLPTPPG